MKSPQIHLRHRMTKVFALLAILVLLAAACGSDDASETDASDSSDTTEASGDDTEASDTTEATGDDMGEPVVITAWFNGESVPSDDFAMLEEEYNVVVEWDIRGDNILTDMLRMRDAGQELPDIVEIDSHLTPAFIEAGLIQPMDEQQAKWEEEDPELYATIPDIVWEQGTYDGGLYHYPNKSLVDAMFYNINILEEAGVDLPPYDTWADFLDAARGVQAALPDLPAYYGTGGSSHDRMFRWAYAFGVPFDDNIPNLTTDQGVAMIDFLQTMHDEGITDPEFMIGQQDEAKGAFVAGEMPFIDEGLNGGPGFMVDGFVYGEDWATAPYPINEEDGGVYLSVPRGWSMSVDTEHPYEASLALRYLSEPDIAAERYLILESGIVQSLPVLEERIPEAQPFFTPELMEIFRGLEAQVPWGTNTNSVGEVLIDLVEELTVVGTDDSPADVAARYQSRLDEL